LEKNERSLTGSKASMNFVKKDEHESWRNKKGRLPAAWEKANPVPKDSGLRRGEISLAPGPRSHNRAGAFLVVNGERISERGGVIDVDNPS